MSCHNDPHFGGAVCKPDFNMECTCQENDIYKPDPYDYSAYMRCNPEPSMFSCENYEEFDIERERCMSMPIGPPCTALGIFPNLNDCRWYQVCRWSILLGNYHQSHVRCPKEGYYYSVGHRQCVRKDDLPDDDPCIVGYPVDEDPIEETLTSFEPPRIILPESDYTLDDVGIPDDDNEDYVDSSESEEGETEARIEKPQTYSCPASVFLFVYWLPGVAEYACSNAPATT